MTIWYCPRCTAELGELNAWCEYCKQSDNIIIFNPDKYYIRDIRIFHIMNGDKAMTPQESLFARYCNEEIQLLAKINNPEDFEQHRVEVLDIEKEARIRLTAIDSVERERQKGIEFSTAESFFHVPNWTLMTDGEDLFYRLFSHERILVCDMDTLTLRAHRDELANIAFKAKAMNKVISEDSRVKKNAKFDGFKRSVNIDEASTNAINIVKERQKKLTKMEKIQERMMKDGISREIAEQLTSAGALLAKLKDKKSKNIILGNETRSPLSQENGFTIARKIEEPETAIKSKPFSNPFEKK